MKRLLILVLLVGFAGGAGFWAWRSTPEAERQSRAAPEGASGFRQISEVRTQRFMVAAANKHASKAAYDIIKAGGNAVDALVAAQMMLTLVEPQSSGIGGGAFLLHWAAASQQLTSYDGRETAPQAVPDTLFLRADGSRLGFGEAVRSGRSIGVPGVVALLSEVHEKHGALAWAKLFEPVIALSRRGFAVSPRLHKMLKAKGAAFFNDEARRLFFDEAGTALPVGTLLKNPALAESMALLAKDGARAFYNGPLSKAIIKAAKAAPAVASLMTLEDLKAYTPRERPPVCGAYRAYQICGMGPPSSGGLTTAMSLGLIAPFQLGDQPNARALHIIAEAEKLAYADRNRYMADPDFVAQPGRLLAADYLAQRRLLIKPEAAMERAEPGNPFLHEKSSPGRDNSVETGGTSHLSIVDREGNVVSMTSSIEGAFGSGQMAAGFLLNNQLTDFAFQPVDEEGRAVANRVEAGKRPRSSMAPTIVFNDAGRPRLVLGSPGGSRIILYVVKALVAHIDWGMGPQEAVSLFNYGSRNGPFEIEVRPESEGLMEALAARGQTVKRAVMTSGAQMILIEPDGLFGGTDPRREGVVLGE